MFSNLGTTEILIIVAVLVVLFGARFLPKMGKNLGQSKVDIKKAAKDLKSAIKEKE